MKWLMMTGGVVLLLALIVLAVGFALPQDHVASGEIRVAASMDAAWRVVTGIDNFADWRPDVTRIERLPDRNGQPAWTEHSSRDRITFAVESSTPPTRWVVRIADPELPFGGTWTYELRPADGGSALRITERGEVYNPIFRFVSRFVIGHDTTIRKYLAAFEQRMQTAGAEHAHGI